MKEGREGKKERRKENEWIFCVCVFSK